MQGKQAKVLSPTQERAIVGYLDTTRYPARDRVIFLLSVRLKVFWYNTSLYTTFSRPPSMMRHPMIRFLM